MSRTPTFGFLLPHALAGCADWPLVAQDPEVLPSPWAGGVYVPADLVIEEPAGEDWPDTPDDVVPPQEIDLTQADPFMGFVVLGVSDEFGFFAEGEPGDAPFSCGNIGWSGSYTGDVDFVRFRKAASDGICLVLVSDDPPADPANPPSWDVVGFEWTGSCLGEDPLTTTESAIPSVYSRDLQWLEPGFAEVAVYVAGQANAYQTSTPGWRLYGYPAPHVNSCFIECPEEGEDGECVPLNPDAFVIEGGSEI